MTRRREFLVLAAAGLVPRLGPAQGAIQALPLSTLRPGDPLPDWLKPYAFAKQPRRTQFALVQDDGRTVLRALAEGSTAGLVRELRVDPRMHPILLWRWKTMNLLEKSDPAKKEGDDFPVRLYLTFDLDPEALSLGELLKLSFRPGSGGGSSTSATLPRISGLPSECKRQSLTV